MCEYDGQDLYQRHFAYGNYTDEVLFMITDAPGTRKFYVHDHLYSPAALIDKDGNVVERYEYDAYGSCQILEPNFTPDPDGKSDYENPYLFTGRRVDILDNGSLKIQYNRNRCYDYYIGRWLTHDPLGYIDGMNLYEYVKSNPCTLTDLMGYMASSSNQYGYCFCVSSLNIKDVVPIPGWAPPSIPNARNVGVEFTVTVTGQWKCYKEKTQGPKIQWMEKFTVKPSGYWDKDTNKWHIIRDNLTVGYDGSCNEEQEYFVLRDRAGMWTLLGIHNEVDQHMQFRIRACSTPGCGCGTGCVIASANHWYYAHSRTIFKHDFEPK